MEFVPFINDESLSVIIDDKGYVRRFVGMNAHPFSNKGYVLEHRLVLEAQMGRYLGTNEVVHHINEVKTDNRIQNLYLCTPEEHVQIHNRGRHSSLERRAQIRKGVQRANRRRNQKN